MCALSNAKQSYSFPLHAAMTQTFGMCGHVWCYARADHFDASLNKVYMETYFKMGG